MLYNNQALPEKAKIIFSLIFINRLLLFSIHRLTRVQLTMPFASSLSFSSLEQHIQYGRGKRNSVYQP